MSPSLLARKRRRADGAFALAPLAAMALALVGAAAVRAADWPQFLGPARNGVYSRPDELSRSWPEDGPPALWKRTVGQGFSGPVISAGRLILFHRLGAQEVIECLDAASGKTLWKTGYPTHYADDFGFDEGPRATPAIDSGKVYTLGAEGMIHCLDLETGRIIWRFDAKERFHAGKGFFGIACSPLIDDNALLLNLGGRPHAGIVAFNKITGRVLWTATDDEASYSSPVAATLAGRRLALFFTRAGLVALDPADGTVETQFHWRSREEASVNAASPVVINGAVFISASYQTGAALLRLRPGSVEVVWSGDSILSNHYATSVCKDGFLYGFDGRQEFGPSFRCVEAATGKIRWSVDHFGAGTALLAGDLFLLMEDGRLLRVAANPDKYRLLAEAHVLPSGVRAYPALANGCLYARSPHELVDLDLRAR